MKDIFNFTYECLQYLSKISGFTYKEINIIIWFIILPLSWTLMIDKIKGKNIYYFSCFYAMIIMTVLVISDFSDLSKTLFNKSADMLRSLHVVGANYTVSSVVICLSIPLIIYIILIKKAYFSNRTN